MKTSLCNAVIEKICTYILVEGWYVLCSFQLIRQTLERTILIGKEPHMDYCISETKHSWTTSCTHFFCHFIPFTSTTYPYSISTQKNGDRIAEFVAGSQAEWLPQRVRWPAEISYDKCPFSSKSNN